jgi:hypothetical protein
MSSCSGSGCSWADHSAEVRVRGTELESLPTVTTSRPATRCNSSSIAGEISIVESPPLPRHAKMVPSAAAHSNDDSGSVIKRTSLLVSLTALIAPTNPSAETTAIPTWMPSLLPWSIVTRVADASARSATIAATPG